MASDKSDRTEKPTPKKLADARKKGQVAQSREIPSAMILLAALGFFYFAGGFMFQRMQVLITGSYQRLNAPVLQDALSASALARWCFDQVIVILMPIMLLLVVVGVMANISQFGFLIKENALAPDFKKINPLTGLKRLVSLKSLVELVKSVFKILFVGAIAYLILKRDLDVIPALTQMDVADIMVFTGEAAFKIAFFVCLGLIVLAAADFSYQRWQHQKELMMTKQEIKEERKQMDGDPQIKARIRSMQIEMARRRMMEMVPEADVVITNPTHLAIAIRFDADTMAAPEVVAKGADHMAQRIRETAEAHAVPRVENKPLARSLYKSTEIGDPVPVELYQAIAEVLAYVYRLKGIQPAS
ncbi:MAG: flagellar biosynthesis protein FlhB [Desulfobacterales bacterium]|nr:flagellar biosynthesis protein FlhB [Desulfobacterales bacterium]MDJ0886230.1 flagellar biosynthesis protein FlhB [Desulfobacterales bacterium]MDJ0990380.1 flagellar biosynthesis protein FlhB [Desulfobacterales bacterium]